MVRVTVFLCIGLLGLSSIAYALMSKLDPSTNNFVTWDSLEPDKWSSIWLIKTHIDPDASIEVRPTGDPLGGGILFGVPKASYKRSGNQSTFESLLIGFEQQDPALKRLGAIITAIETTAWNVASDPTVHTVEQNFRRLQDKYGRAYVPISCYGHFFNVLYDGLLTNSDTGTLHQSLSQAVDNQSCKDTPLLAERKKGNRVTELTTGQLLTEIALKKDVVFVDTREPAEFAKSHIPGAINIPMRDLTPEVYNQLKQADRVISYCVKDFRGYEVARQMLDNGVSNVAVMKPYGLSGWQASGLPLVSKEVSETAAQEQLTHCARDQQSCLNL